MRDMEAKWARDADPELHGEIVRISAETRRRLRAAERQHRKEQESRVARAMRRNAPDLHGITEVEWRRRVRQSQRWIVIAGLTYLGAAHLWPFVLMLPQAAVLMMAFAVLIGPERLAGGAVCVLRWLLIGPGVRSA
ncbi:hypothetical protein SAMN04490248_11115 [Salinihabitans flavidus]|uniref:Uncharacterized protein n=1 Tax=Salinihabitans flavidus TaxID=569882 RepID=A0A1H8S6K9_9RHOB|nr:hypothetical protein [Salinihabitans flavidus]SEO74321.1 hypothetical protein SAMN04490248_11115 [Salinihabitans flavidus]